MAVDVSRWSQRFLLQVLALLQVVVSQSPQLRRALRRERVQRRRVYRREEARRLAAQAELERRRAERRRRAFSRLKEAGPAAPAGVEVVADLPPDERQARKLPFSLFVTTGSRSVPLFPSGEIDELCFFQRSGISAEHEMEFISRLDLGEEGTENYKPFGVFRFRSSWSLPFPDLDAAHGFWTALYRDFGLIRIPPASRVLGETRCWDPRAGEEPDVGRNRLSPRQPGRVFQRALGRSYTHADLLEILCRTMGPLERIAWIEEGLRAPLKTGEIVHRYYVGRDRRLHLVRHHWRDGKLLIPAQTSAEALKLCQESGLFSRDLRQAA